MLQYVSPNTTPLNREDNAALSNSLLVDDLAEPSGQLNTYRTHKAITGQTLSICLLLFAVCFVSGGASCPGRHRITEFNPPLVFEATPTLPEIIEQVNHSLAIQSLESNHVTISSADIPVKPRGNLTWERTHNFKLEAFAGSRFLGTAFAAGSNSDMFWLQLSSPPTLYYAKHDEFNNQLGPRHILPVSPLWLREALGVIELDPSQPHEGPTRRADGKIEIVSYIPSGARSYRRVIVLDPSHATIEQTLLYDETKLVAVSQMREHKYFSEIDFSLPKKIDIQLHPDQGSVLAFTIEIGFYMINQATGSSVDAYQPPDASGLSTVNLVQANAQSVQMVPTPPAYTRSQATRRPGSLAGYRSVQ